MVTCEPPSDSKQIHDELEADEFFTMKTTDRHTPVSAGDFTAILPDELLRDVSIIEQYWVSKPYQYAVVCEIGDDTVAYVPVTPQLQDRHSPIKDELVYRVQKRLNGSSHDVELDGEPFEDKYRIQREVMTLFDECNTLPGIDISSIPKESTHTDRDFNTPFSVPRFREILSQARNMNITLQDGCFETEVQHTEELGMNQVERFIYHIQQEVLEISDIEPLSNDIHITDIKTRSNGDLMVTHTIYGKITLYAGIRII